MRIRIRSQHVEQLNQHVRNAYLCSSQPSVAPRIATAAAGAVVAPLPVKDESSRYWVDPTNHMRLPRSLAAALYQTQNTQSKRSIGNMEKPSFTPKKVLILSKLTRYEFEKRVNKGCSDEQLATLLKKRGSDYGRLLSKHKIHHSYLNTLQRELENAGIESRLVRRFGYTQEAVDWADAVFSAGGDGTFLMASSRVRTKHKPVIGINTDPQGSEGYMCLMRKLPEENLAGALKKLFSGNFE